MVIFHMLVYWTVPISWVLATQLRMTSGLPQSCSGVETVWVRKHRIPANPMDKTLPQDSKIPNLKKNISMRFEVVASRLPDWE